MIQEKISSKIKSWYILLFSKSHDAISSLCQRARAKLIVYQLKKTSAVEYVILPYLPYSAVERRFEDFTQYSAERPENKEGPSDQLKKTSAVQ